MGVSWEVVWASTGHGPPSYGHKSPPVSNLGGVWGCQAGFFLLPQEAERLRKAPGRSPRELPGTDMPPISTELPGWLPWRSLGLLPSTSPPSAQGYKILAAAREEPRGGTGRGPASSIYKTPRVATLEESGAATWDFSSLHRRPEVSRRCLTVVPPGMELPPAYTKVLG